MCQGLEWRNVGKNVVHVQSAFDTELYIICDHTGSGLKVLLPTLPAEDTFQISWNVLELTAWFYQGNGILDEIPSSWEVSEFVGAVSPINQKGLYQGWRN